MDMIKEYFKKKTENITFIELKESASLGIKGYPVNSSIPLPIITDVLVEEIKAGKLEEEIKISHIIDGIIYLMGIDSSFIYIEDYKNILINYSEKIEEYIFYCGIKFMDKNEYDNGAIYFRTLKLINPINVNGIFNYALALEGLAKEFFSKEQEDEGIQFLHSSTLELESILDINDKYPLAYYKLGFHYKFFELYLKAKLIWTKHLMLDKDDLRLQEIREEIDQIENDVAIESGLTYLSHEQFDRALDIFLKLLPQYDKCPIF